MELTFWYRNYEGKEGYRRARVKSIRHGTSKWHENPQWLMLATDLEIGEDREFAMADIRSVVGASYMRIADMTLGAPGPLPEGAFIST